MEHLPCITIDHCWEFIWLIFLIITYFLCRWTNWIAEKISKAVTKWQMTEGAIIWSRNKPQTLSYAMNDSPVGLIHDRKNHTWSDSHGDIDSCHKMNTNITLIDKNDQFSSPYNESMKWHGSGNVQPVKS
jgi:hypothetical protein